MEYNVIGGPLNGQRRAISEAEHSELAGGFYRLLESEYWGFDRAQFTPFFYFWYEGGKNDPVYWEDAAWFGWHSEPIVWVGAALSRIRARFERWSRGGIKIA